MLRRLVHTLRDHLRAVRRSRRPRPAPPRNVAFVELSNICNAQCVFCSYPTIAQSGKPLRHMDKEVFERALALATSLGYHRLAFTPTTGEILANPLWDEFLTLALRNDDVHSLYFYSNAILLKESAIEKLLRLPNPNKIEALFFSVGGTDAESYREMFGVDKFRTVNRNLNALCAHLKQHNRTTPVHCEARVPKNSQVTPQDVEKTFNTAGYPHFHANVLRAYDPLGGLIARADLSYLRPIPDKTEPCYRLTDIRFDALGRIWMCGCVVSERPNDVSLLIGNVADKPDFLAAAQAELIRKWKEGYLPRVCQSCRVYKPTK